MTLQEMLNDYEEVMDLIDELEEEERQEEEMESQKFPNRMEELKYKRQFIK